MAKSTFLENSMLDAVLSAVTYTSPTTVYLALYTAAPSSGGGGTEVSGNAYARQSATFTSASGGAVSVASTVTFPAATPAGWGTIGWVGVFDDPTAGNFLYYGTLTTPKVIAIGDQLEFASGALTITES